LSTLSSGKKRDVNHIRIAPSAALLSLSVVLCSSIFAQLYLLPYNPLSGIVQDNKAYAEKEFKMKISVDQDPIQTGDTQKITVTVRDANTNDKISDAFVKLAIDPPSGKVATGSSHTDDNGQTTFNIRISSDADTGTFNVAARASANSYASKTVTAPFEVISSDNNNNNDNNNQDSGAHNNNDHNGHNHNGANNNNNNNNDQVQVISQSNVCGNGKLANDVKCQNIGNQIQSGGHNKDGSKHGQSQSIAQANVCGNGKGASDVNCQNLANQVQGDGNAVNVIGVQSGDDNKDNAEQPSSNDQSDTGFAKTGHDSSNNNNNNNAAGSDSGVNDNAFSDACNQAVNRHIAAGGLHGEMAKQMRGQLCG